MPTCCTAYTLSEENWRHSILHCAGVSRTASAGRSGHSEAATISKPEAELAAVSAVAMLSWLLLDALPEACPITAVSTTDTPLSCTSKIVEQRSLHFDSQDGPAFQDTAHD